MLIYVHTLKNQNMVVFFVQTFQGFQLYRVRDGYSFWNYYPSLFRRSFHYTYNIYIYIYILQCDFCDMQLSANAAIVQMYHVENKLIFNAIKFVLDRHAQLDFYSASSQKQQSVVQMSPNFDTLLLSAVCLVEKQQIPILQSGLYMNIITYLAYIKIIDYR